MFQRPDYLNQLIDLQNTDFIKIITGVRRSGKSVLLMLYQRYLLEQGVEPNHIIYINFESFNYQVVTDAEKFRDVLAPLIPQDEEKVYFLFDEIQLVDGWQRVVNGIKTSFSCELVITGSNANMLSGELATLLSGRYIEIPIYPLSFDEFLTVKDIARLSVC